MTRDLLEQYPAICAEMKSLRVMVSDVVSASSPEHPFTLHAQRIQGEAISDNELFEKLTKQKAEIESFVRGLPNSELRMIVRMKAFEQRSWEGIAGQMSRVTGRYYSSIALRVKYHRMFSKSM